jgi:tRNA-specific adenosine deaminase 2
MAGFSPREHRLMQLALDEGERALRDLREVPVGCVIVLCGGSGSGGSGGGGGGGGDDGGGVGGGGGGGGDGDGDGDSGGDEILAVGSNRTNLTRNATRHAEFVAVDAVLAAGHSRAVFRRCELFVTCEPCIMCAAALRLLGFRKVFFGCRNDRFGGCGSVLPVHDFEVSAGLMETEAIELLRSFYSRGNERAPDSKRKRALCEGGGDGGACPAGV